MEAKELRIGNLFTTVAPVSGSWYEKQRYDKDILIATKETFWQWDEKNFKGISISEEWLLKFGFSKMTVQPLWRKTEGEYTLDSEDFLFDFKSKHIYADSGLTLHPIGNEIQHVHTLQNAYFALTGNELTLTPANQAT